jgi:hypothetical protein
MSCHEENKEKQVSHKHSPLKHMLHMAICCGLPIIIIGALPLITRFSPAPAAMPATVPALFIYRSLIENRKGIQAVFQIPGSNQYISLLPFLS